MTGTSDSVAVAIAERYLADAVEHSQVWDAHYPKPEGDPSQGALSSSEEASVRLIEIILEYAKETEDALLHVGAAFDANFTYATAIRLAEDGGAHSIRGVKLSSDRLGWSVVELSITTVRRIAYFCRQRSLVDRIRVYGQLVHYFHGLLGPWKCAAADVSSEYISGLIIAIELLVTSLNEYHSEGHGAVVKRDQGAS